MRLISILSLVILLFASCYKDIDETIPVVVISEQPKIEVETGLIGQVLDHNDLPISDYELLINGKIYNVPGSFFNFQIAGLQKEGQLVEVHKENQLIAVGYPYLIENDLNKISLVSLSESNRAPYTGATDLDQGNISIELAPAELEKANGETADQVMIKSQVITDRVQLIQMGMSAFDAAGSLKAMNPIKGFLLEFESDTEPLKIASGRFLSLSIFEHLGRSLFVYHKSFEYWVELGVIGENDLVTDQLGYFMIAEVNEGVYHESTIKQNGFAVSYIKGATSIDGFDFPYTTTEKGQWAQVLPAEAEIDLVVLDPCGEIIQKQALIASSNFDTEIVIDKETRLFNLVTEILTCDGRITDDPTVEVAGMGNSEIYVFSDQNVDRIIAVCESDFEVAGYDLDSGNTGPSVTWKLEKSESVDYLSNCKELADGYTYLKINNEEEQYPAFSYTVDNGVTTLSSANNSIRLKFNGDIEKMYETTEVNVFMDAADFGNDGYAINCENSTVGCGFNEFSVTHFENENGGLIRVVFQGVLWMQTIENPTAGNYDVEGVILIRI